MGIKSYRFQIENGKLKFILYYDGWHTIINGSQALSVDTWYHVAVTFNGAVARTYIDGIQDNYNNISYPIGNSVNYIYVGAESASDLSFPGIIDELQIIKIARTADEIYNYYQSTK